LAFGEMADEMLLGGVRVAPHELTAAGFDFVYPELEPALRHLLDK
jgi:NAD dependent epimerase/dehydratase family enzyme